MSSCPDFSPAALAGVPECWEGGLGTDLASSLARLGFHAQPHVQLTSSVVLWTFVHPGGVLLTASHHTAKTTVDRIQVAAAVRLGWRDEACLRGVTHTSWTEPDGQVYALMRMNLRAGDLVVQGVLAHLHHLGVEAFPAWIRLAQHHPANGELFTLDSDVLLKIDKQLGLDAWLQGACPDLVAFVRAKVNSASTLWEAVNQMIGQNLLGRTIPSHLRYLRWLGQASGQEYPTEQESATLHAWELGLGTHFCIDVHRQTSGLMQPGWLAWRLAEPQSKAAEALNQWLRMAPNTALRCAVLKPDVLGNTLPQLLLTVMLHEHLLPDDPMIQIIINLTFKLRAQTPALSALSCIVTRLGREAMHGYELWHQLQVGLHELTRFSSQPRLHAKVDESVANLAGTWQRLGLSLGTADELDGLMTELRSVSDHSEWTRMQVWVDRAILDECVPTAVRDVPATCRAQTRL